MSYITAFPFLDGIVMSADTQETVGDEHKRYAEKLYLHEDPSFPLVVGGAGVDELSDAFQQELFSRVATERPQTIAALTAVVKAAIAEVYASDISVATIPKQHRTPEFLVAAKPPDDGFVILRLKGKRVFPVKSWAIIGYATAANRVFMERLYRESLTVGQAVLVAVHLVSQSKQLDQGVGGDTSVAVIQSHGAWFEPDKYLKHDEARTQEFMRLTDDLFLSCTDTELATAELKSRLDEFSLKAIDLHRGYIRDVTKAMLSRGINLVNEPRSRIPPGSLITFGGGMGVYEPDELDASAKTAQQSEPPAVIHHGDGPMFGPAPSAVQKSDSSPSSTDGEPEKKGQNSSDD